MKKKSEREKNIKNDKRFLITFQIRPAKFTKKKYTQ